MKRVFLSAMVLVLFAIALSAVAVTLARPNTALAAQLYSIGDDPNDPEPQPESVFYIDDDPNDPEPQPENALCIDGDPNEPEPQPERALYIDGDPNDPEPQPESV
jgi:hypothetical protein